MQNKKFKLIVEDDFNEYTLEGNIHEHEWRLQNEAGYACELRLSYDCTCGAIRHDVVPLKGN